MHHSDAPGATSSEGDDDDSAVAVLRGSSIIESIPLRFVAVIGVLFVAELMVMALLDAYLPVLEGARRALVDALLLSFLSAPPVWFVLLRPVWVELRTERAVIAREHAALSAEVRRSELEGRLHRALNMTDRESGAIAVLRRAIHEASPDNAAELRLATGSDPNLRRVTVSHPGAESADDFTHGCRVTDRDSCVATRQGRTLVFPDSHELDACPKMLREGTDGHSAACVPLSIVGRAVGVIHATGAAGQPPEQEVLEDLEAIAYQAGARLGTLRAMRESDLAASTDPLTGLLNRRSLEDKVRVLERGGHTLSVVMADLDHFKKLNDSHTHTIGDQALTTFVRR